MLISFFACWSKSLSSRQAAATPALINKKQYIPHLKSYSSVTRTHTKHNSLFKLRYSAFVTRVISRKTATSRSFELPTSSFGLPASNSKPPTQQLTDSTTHQMTPSIQQLTALHVPHHGLPITHYASRIPYLSACPTSSIWLSSSNLALSFS